MTPPPPDRPTPPWRLAAVVLGLLISAASVIVIARDVPGQAVRAAFTQADGVWIAIGLGLALISIVARVWRWAFLLQPISYPRPALTYALLGGQLLNLLLPVRLGDVARAVLISRVGGTVERALGSLLIEKAWDWLMLTALIAVVALSIPLPEWLMTPARVIGLIAVLVLIALGVAALSPTQTWPRWLARIDRALGWSPARPRLWVIERLQRLLESLGAVRGRRQLSGGALSTVAVWSLGALINYAVMRAFGVDSLTGAALLLAVLMVGVALPPSIAAIGVFEGLSLLALGVMGVRAEVALAIGLTLHVLILSTPAVVLGGLALSRPLPTRAL